MSRNETNTDNHTTMFSIVLMRFIQEHILYYLPLVFIIFGIFGFIGNAITFLQPSLRYNTCCIYLLCESLIDMTNLLINLTVKYIYNSDNILPLIMNRYQCKLRLFGLVFFPQFSMNLLILSLIDRYACTCSLTSSIRYIRHIQFVPCIILLTIIISSLMSFYAPYFHDIQPGFGCTSTNPLVNGIFYIILHGLVAPCVMLIFVLLTNYNVKKSRLRSGPTNILNIDRSRNPFLRMIFTQVLSTSLLSFQWIIFYIYHIIRIYQLKTNEQKFIHYFFWSITNNIYYLINVKSFYLSTLTSRLFRTTFFNVFGLHTNDYQSPQYTNKYQENSMSIFSKK